MWALSLDTSDTVEERVERGVGNIYERLDAARRKREEILDIPEPANEDRRAAVKSRVPDRVFPTLKPPRPPMPVVATEPKYDRFVPWFLGLLIFVVIFAFAVG